MKCTRGPNEECAVCVSVCEERVCVNYVYMLYQCCAGWTHGQAQWPFNYFSYVTTSGVLLTHLT